MCIVESTNRSYKKEIQVKNSSSESPGTENYQEIRDNHKIFENKNLCYFEKKNVYRYNEVHQKDNISRILWHSDWLHNTTSAGNSIFVTNHNTTSCGRSIMQPIRLP